MGEQDSAMSQIRIKREALDKVERALEEYRELLAQLEADMMTSSPAASTPPCAK